MLFRLISFNGFLRLMRAGLTLSLLVTLTPSMVHGGISFPGPRSEADTLEEKIQRIEGELAELPRLILDPTPWTLGYRSGWMSRDDQVVTIDISFTEETAIDLLALVPAIYAPESQAAEPFGFPKRFLIESLSAEGGASIVVDCSEKDYYPSGIEPQIFKLKEPQLSKGIRLTIFRHAENPTWWNSRYITALSEIMVFSGEWNVALGAKVETSHQRPFGSVWDAQCLVDGFCLFSATEGTIENPARNYYYPSRKLILHFDLKEPREIDELRIWPVKHSAQHHFPQVNGVEFPTSIRFEKITQNGEFTSAIVYEDIEKPIRPGAGPLMLRLPITRGQYFRLILSDPLRDFRIEREPRIAISEIEILSKGHVLTQGLRPRVVGKPGRNLERLTDGRTNEGRILNQRAWVQGLHRRAFLERQLANLRQELVFSRRQEAERLWWLISLIVIFVPLLIWLVRMKVNQRWRKDRDQLASDLHDEIGANVSSITHTVELLKETLPNASLTQAQMLDEAIQTAVLTSEETHNFIQILESNKNDFNLLEQLPEIGRRVLGNIPLTCDIDPKLFLKNLPVKRKWDLLLFVKEALNNVIKHAEASHVEMTLTQHGRARQLIIRDNGEGMPDQQKVPRHLRLRAKRLKGQLQISSTLGQGTCISLRF
ncbi:MAG: histidine kinase [Verrucomicrobiota bacterium JB023]|nr:histidine kinase [Verrucomicrobiota bacterium JB023]